MLSVAMFQECSWVILVRYIKFHTVVSLKNIRYVPCSMFYNGNIFLNTHTIVKCLYPSLQIFRRKTNFISSRSFVIVPRLHKVILSLLPQRLQDIYGNREKSTCRKKQEKLSVWDTICGLLCAAYYINSYSVNKVCCK